MPAAREEWGVAGGGEAGEVTEQETEAQMQQEAPDEAAPTPTSATMADSPAPARKVSAHVRLNAHTVHTAAQ